MELYPTDFLVYCASNECSMRFLQVKGILQDQPPCPTYEAPMALVKDASTQLDGFRWRCRIHRNDKSSVRDDRWLADSRLTFQQFIITAYFWSVGIQNHQIISMLNLSESTVVQYFQYFRDVCSHWLLENPIQLGRVAYTVQIDESLLSKRKNNRGHILPQQWIFGIYDVEKKLDIYERYKIGRQLPYCR